MQALHVTLALLCSASCHTLASTPIASATAPVVRMGARARVWEVRCGGERLGLVVLFQERGLACDCVYVVRNPWHQDLGLIDGLGRAFRYVPHMEEPAWVGSGTIVEGAQRILGAAAACELVELDSDPDPVPGATPTAAEAPTNDPFESTARPSSAPRPDGGLPQSR